jgi:TonB family protein
MLTAERILVRRALVVARSLPRGRTEPRVFYARSRARIPRAREARAHESSRNLPVDRDVIHRGGCTMERMNERLEVILSWGSSPLATELFTDASVVIGETGDAAFALPSEVLEMPFTLATRTDDGWLVRIPAVAIARASKRVGDADESIDLAGLTCDGLGTRTISIAHGMTVEVALGGFSFCLRLAGELERIATATPFDWKLLRWFGASALFHAVIVIVLLLQPPQAGALSVDVDRSALEFIQVTLDAYSTDVVPPPATTTGPSGPASSEGRPMEGAPGAAGTPNERRTGGNVRVRGADREPRVPLTAEDVRALRTLAGIELASLSIRDISSPFGAEDAAGWDTEDAYGPLTLADGVGPGSHGFDMIGDGRGTCPAGAAHCGEGTIGVGNFDTIGRDGGCSQEEFSRLVELHGRSGAMDRCSGSSHRAGNDTIDREGGVPTVRPAGDAVAVGGLSKEEVRRIVRRNLAQVRFCYEQGLQQSPDLEGRVSVQFHIAPSGAVQNASVASTSIRNGAVEQCVLQAARRWSFPQSPGLTVVTYPFLFQHP